MKKYIKICPECGNTFETDYKDQKCCKPCIVKVCKQYLPEITDLVGKLTKSLDEALDKEQSNYKRLKQQHLKVHETINKF